MMGALILWKYKKYKVKLTLYLIILAIPLYPSGQSPAVIGLYQAQLLSVIHSGSVLQRAKSHQGICGYDIPADKQISHPTSRRVKSTEQVNYY